MTLRESLKRDESLRLKPYTDSTGHLTIGWGYNLDNGIPREIADRLLDIKLNEAVADVASYLPWSLALAEPRRDVLANMTYNLGIHGLLGFRRALAAMQAGDFETASAEMLDSQWAQQVGPRAHRLAAQMRTGTA